MKYCFEESITQLDIREVHIHLSSKEFYSFRSYFWGFGNFKLIFAFGRR